MESIYKYDVSIIIPVYNNEEYIESCVESIRQQDYDLSKIQIIIINDGSSDNSLEVCESLSDKYKEITLINEENKGVSEARNNGIKVSEGKYVMLLDSDDMISNKTVKSLVKFFDENYDEVDLVAYPLVIEKNKKSSEHYRYKLFNKGTNIYDINEFPYNSQSTINVIIKRQILEKYHYNVNMSFSEDEDLNTRIIMLKEKIGFCKEAKYIYRKHDNCVTNNKTNPYYCFDNIIEYNKELIKLYKNNNELPKYIQGIILNNIRWRIVSDDLLPYYKKGDDFTAAFSEIKDIIKYIDIETIRDMPNMDIYHKFAVINMKDTPIKYYFGAGLYTINTEKEIIYSSNNAVIVLNKFKYYKDTIKIVGYIKSPLFYYTLPKLYIKIIDKDHNIDIKEIDLKNSNCNQYKTKMKVAQFYNFNINVKIDEIKSFGFHVEVDQNRLSTKYYFTSYVPFDMNLKRYSIFKDNYQIKFNPKPNVFSIMSLTEKKLKELKRIQLKNILKKHKKVAIFRLLANKNKDRKIWLYCDRDGIFDNAYYQFKHDININDGIERYYVIDDNFENVKHKFNQNEYKNIIRYKSFRHKILFLSAEKILTSFQYITYYSPFKDGIKWYRDIIRYELVYLQHGVLHCHTPWIYSNEKNEIDKIVVSSDYEINNFINNYNYETENLIPSGMPRFDLVDISNKPMKKIVYAPTWRANLIGDIQNNRRFLKQEQFLESNYFKKIYKLLHSNKLIQILKNSEYTFEFKIHPVFKDYIDLFEVSDNEYIKLSCDEIKLDEYCLFITDYSSYIFDYVYLERPIVYFLPDSEEFDAGLHTYRKLDLPLEEAFGDITSTENELIDKIRYYIDNGFEIENKYKDRINNFFITKNNHRNNLYKYLTE